MIDKETQKQLSKITREIIRKARPERIILFGSYAYGRPRKNSDFDFFIIKNSSLRQIDRARQIRRILPSDRTIGVDLLVYSEGEVKQALAEKNVFINKVLSEGKEIYAKNKGSHQLAQES